MAEKQELRVGSKAPSFSLMGSTGRVSLSDLIGQHHLLLYFVREFGCHTCMSHALSLAKIQAELSVANTRVAMIGGGDLDTAEKTAKKYKLSFPVLADPDRSVYAKYGLDKTLLFIQKSGSFLIDRDGVVRYVHTATNPGASLDKAALLAASGSMNRLGAKA